MKTFVTINGVEFVQIAEKPGRVGFRVLARRDFNPDVHTPYVDTAEPSLPAPVPPAGAASTGAPATPSSDAPPATPPATAPATAPSDAPPAEQTRELNANEIKAQVFKSTDVEALKALAEAEFQRETPRKTVVDAIDNRLKALTATPAAE